MHLDNKLGSSLEKSSHQVKVKVMDASELYDPEFRELIKSKNPTIIIPVGSLEQHGAHLPITTDSDIVTEIASRLAKKCDFIVFPTISYGVSKEHDPLVNISLESSTLWNIIGDIDRAVVKKQTQISYNFEWASRKCYIIKTSRKKDNTPKNIG